MPIVYQSAQNQVKTSFCEKEYHSRQKECGNLQNYLAVCAEIACTTSLTASAGRAIGRPCGRISFPARHPLSGRMRALLANPGAPPGFELGKTANAVALLQREVPPALLARYGEFQELANVAAHEEIVHQRFLPHRGLRGMRCSGSIRFVLCRPVPRKVWQIIVATRISCLTPSLPMTQRSG